MKASRTRNYLRGLASGYVVTFATIVVGLWLTPFSLRFLSREEYAVFALASDVLMWLGLLDIGLTSVLNVKAAQQTGRPDPQLLDNLASTTCFAQCGIALLLLLAGSLFTIAFPAFFGLSGALRHSSQQVMALLVLGSAISIGTQTFSALLVAHQQIHIDNLLKLGLIAIRTSLTVGLLLSGYGLISLAIANLMASLTMACLAVIRVWRLLPNLRIRISNFSWETLRSTTGTGIWFSLGALAGMLIMGMDRLVTAKLVSVEMVTTLSLTGRMYALAWSIILQVTNTARPALAQIIGEGRLDHAKAKYHQLVTISTGMAVILAASIWAGNGAFVSWWVGEQNYGGGLLDAFLAINLVMHAWVLPSRAILVAGMAFVPQNNICRIIEGVTNMALSVCLGMVWGVPGIVMATAVAGIGLSCWYFPVLVSRYFNITPMTLIGADLFKTGAIFLLILPFCFVGRWLAFSLDGIAGAISGGVFCIVSGLVIIWTCVLECSAKERIVEIIGRK